MGQKVWAVGVLGVLAVGAGVLVVVLGGGERGGGKPATAVNEQSESVAATATATERPFQPVERVWEARQPQGQKAWFGVDLSVPPVREVRTGHVIPMDKLGDRFLKPTLVTLRAEGEHPRAVLEDIAAHADAVFRLEPGQFWDTMDWPGVNFDLKEVPLLEALMQLCAQQGWHIWSNNSLTVRPNTNGRTNGPWCVAGKFLFVLDPAPNIYLGATHGGGIGSRERIIQVITEPGVMVTKYPSTWTITEATDDTGEAVTGELNTGVNGEHALRLLLSRGMSGKQRLALRGEATFEVATKHATVEVGSAAIDKGMTADAGGMTVEIDKVYRSERGLYFMSATFAQGSMSDEEWRKVKEYVHACRMQVFDRNGLPYTYSQREVTREGDTVKVTSQFWRNGPSTDIQGWFTAARLDVPLEARAVRVPIVFPEVPLQTMPPARDVTEVENGPAGAASRGAVDSGAPGR